MVNVRPISKQLQKVANEELNENESRLPEDLQHIRNWLKKQPHLRVREDDQLLVTFLRGCKYSLEKTKSKLDLYYSFRTISPEYCKDRYPFSTVLKDLLNLSSFSILSQGSTLPTPTLCLLRWNSCNSKNCTLQDIYKFWLMGVDMLLNEDDNAVICGLEFIVDYSEFTLNYALQTTPVVTKKIVLYVENGYPIRIKAIHIINAPPILESIHSMAKVFMSEKFKNRIFIHSPGNINELYKKIPKNIMPEEYGGDNASVYKLAADFNKKIESYGEWFLDEEKYGSNESLRPVSVKSPQNLLGLEGSFRKLDVD